jgi:hypothetical protein
LAAHEVHVAHLPVLLIRRGPDQASGAGAKKVKYVDTSKRIRGRKGRREALDIAKAVARLIEVYVDAMRREIDKVSGAGAIDIGNADAALVERIAVIQERGIVHCNLGSKASVASIWPIAYFTVTDPDQVNQSIARHVT